MPSCSSVFSLILVAALSLHSAAVAEVRQFVELRDQSPLNCLDDLLAGESVDDICVAKGVTGRCRDRTGSCRSTLKLTIDAVNPTQTLFGTPCYSIVIDDAVDFADGRMTLLEGVGQFCLTPNSNFVKAATACITDDSGETILGAGDFNGGFRPAFGRGTAIRAIHNESVVLP